MSKQVFFSKQQVSLFILLVALSTSQVSADLISCDFPYTYGNPSGIGPRYINTDLNIVPSIAQPTGAICAGDSYSPQLSLSSKWFQSTYDTKLKSNAPLATCLVPYNTVNYQYNNDVVWLSQSTFQQANNTNGKYLGDIATYGNLGLPNANSFSIEKSKYAASSGDGFFILPSGVDQFKASANVLCRASLRLVSTNPNYAYNQELTSEYQGTIPSAYPKPQPTQTSGFKLVLDVKACVALGRSFTDYGACSNTAEGVWAYGRCSQFPRNIESPVVTVTVENPFSCAPLPVSNQFVSNPTPAPGAQVNFGFSLTNNLARNMRVTKIELAQSSITQGFALVGSIAPVPIVINTGNGVQAFTGTVQVPSSPGAKSIKVNITYMPDTPACNGQPNCQMAETQVIDINVASTYSCALAIVPDNTIIGPGTRQVQATCFVNGVAGACANPISWATTFGSITPNPPSPFVSSTLSVPSVTSTQTGAVSASYTVNGNPVSCPAAPFTVQAGNKPDYIISSISIANPLVYVGEPFTSQVTTKNNGSAGTGISSQTNVTFPGSQQVNLPVAGLAIGATSTGAAGFTCPAAANTYYEVAYADALGQIDELNEANNQLSVPVNCSAKPDSCTLLFAGHHGGEFAANDSAQVVARCLANGVATFCPNLTWTQNAAGGSMNPTFTPRAVAPTSTLTLLNAPPATNRVVIANSAEGSIPLQCNIRFNVTYAGPAPATSCEMLPIGHNGNVTIGASWQYAATCRNSTGGLAACPPMEWATNVAGGTMVPLPTFPSWVARNNLSISPNAPSPQAGKSVTAVSLGAVPFSCSSPANVISSSIQIVNCDFENNHGPVFFPGESEYALATCQQNGIEVDCPTLNWATYNLTGASLVPSQTTPPLHRSLFSVASTAQAPQQGGILVQCENPNQCINTCNAQVNVSRIPVNMSCYLLNHGNLFAPGDWSLVQANCTDERIQTTACPALRWLTRNRPIVGSDFIPNPTAAGIKPTTNFSIAPGAPVPQQGFIDAVSVNPIVPGLVCTPAIDTTVANIGPDYNLTLITHDPPTAIIGQPVKISVTTTNIGNQNATNKTTTLLTGEGCADQTSSLPKLNVGETYTQNTFTCTCSKPGWNYFNATVNAYQNQYETTYANNRRESAYYCRTVAQLTCSDFV